LAAEFDISIACKVHSLVLLVFVQRSALLAMQTAVLARRILSVRPSHANCWTTTPWPVIEYHPTATGVLSFSQQWTPPSVAVPLLRCQCGVS